MSQTSAIKKRPLSLLNIQLHQLRSFPRSGRPGAVDRRLTLFTAAVNRGHRVHSELSMANAAVHRECSHDSGLAGVRQ